MSATSGAELLSCKVELEACHERVNELTEGLLHFRDETRFLIEAHNVSLARIEALVSDFLKPVHDL